MMAETSPNLWCTTNQSSVKKQLENLQSKAFKFELVRLLAFALIFVGPFLSSYFPNPIKSICWLSIPVGIFIFIKAVRNHLALKDDIYFLTNTLDAIEQSIKLLENSQTPIGPFKRPAEVIRPLQEHWALSLQETDDLDVYSEGASVFGRINRTSTLKGQQFLAGLIESPLLQVSDINNRAKTYQDLSGQIETLHLLAGNAKAFGEIKDQFQFLKEAIDTRSNIQKTIWPNFVKIYLPIQLIVVGLTIYGVIPQPFLLLALIANIVLAKKIGSVIFPALKPWLSISSLLNYSEMYLQQAIKLETKNGPLAPLTEKSKSLLTSGNLSALKNTVGMIRLRFSGVIHMIVDVLIFWDIRWMVKLEKLMTNRSAFLELENIIGEWEAHISMALQNFINHSGTFAELHDASNCEIVEGRHPLLPFNKSVPNNISLHEKDRAWLISGSNMSGKSTFLRMVGVNILFAQIGLKTYTQKTKICPVRLMTDLRIRDNLFKNESYFLAEVRQLKRMIDTSKGKPLLFGLIDEPYRGTNSEERIAASVEVLRCLLESGGFFLTATHDKEVTEMAEQIPAVSNHHFKEELSESDIAFDYKIRPGPTTTRNALRVLQQEGYPDSVIQNAEAWLQKKNKNTRQF